MFLPPNHSEADVLAAIQKAVNALAPSFAFGPYTPEDIKQEGYIYAIEALPKYDGVRPLENFCYTVIKSRLLNLKRSKLRRSDHPCDLCHLQPDGDTGHEDRRVCARYAAWARTQARKQAVAQPEALTHENVEAQRDRGGSEVVNQAELRDALALLDEMLPLELRATYLQMRAGMVVDGHMRKKVETAVREIVAEHLGIQEAQAA